MNLPQRVFPASFLHLWHTPAPPRVGPVRDSIVLEAVTFEVACAEHPLQ